MEYLHQSSVEIISQKKLITTNKTPNTHITLKIYFKVYFKIENIIKRQSYLINILKQYND